jgi:hypothetical protein
MSDDSPQLPAGPGFDLGALLGSAQEMMQAQAEVAGAEVVGEAAGGKVTVTMTGGLDFLAVHVAPEVIDPDDPEMLEDLILVALRDAAAKVQELQSATLGGLDLGGLGGLLGGGPA